MSKKKLKRGVGGSTDRFVLLPHYMLKSAAWRSLPSYAKALLIEVWVRHNGVNNGEISFGCGEASKTLDFGKTTAKRMFDVLVERGFPGRCAHGEFQKQIVSHLAHHGRALRRAATDQRIHAVARPKRFPSSSRGTDSSPRGTTHGRQIRHFGSSRGMERPDSAQLSVPPGEHL